MTAAFAETAFQFSSLSFGLYRAAEGEKKFCLNVFGLCLKIVNNNNGIMQNK